MMTAQEHITRRYRLIIVGWSVAIFALFCCFSIGVAGLEQRFAQEDRV